MTTFSEIAPLLEGQAIEVPSWAYGNSGTRFKVFGSPGTPRTVAGEDRGRRAGAPVHRARADRRPAHPVGPGRRLRRAPRVRRGPRRRARHDQLQHVPGRRLQARRAHPHRPEDPAEGDRPPLRVHRRHERHRVARPEDLAGRGHQLPGPGRHARPSGPARRESLAHDLRADRRGPAAGARVQVLRAGVLPHRRPGLGHVVRPRGRPRRPGRSSASTPATTRPAPTSSSSSPSCCGSGSSARSTSTAASTPTTT